MDVHGFPPADTAAVFDGRSSSARFVGSSYVVSLLRSRAAAISVTSEDGEWATRAETRISSLRFQVSGPTLGIGGSRREVGKVIWGVPLAEEPHVEHGAGELLGEDRQDAVDSGRRRRADGLDGVLVGRLADLLREPVVVANEVTRRDADPVQRRRVGEVEHLAGVGADLEELAGQQRVDRESLPLGLTRQFGDDAWPGQAQVEDREAVRRVEPVVVPARLDVERLRSAPQLVDEVADDDSNLVHFEFLPSRTAHLLRHADRASDHLVVSDVRNYPPEAARGRPAPLGARG